VTVAKIDLDALNLDRWETNEERFALKRVLALLIDSVTLYPPEVVTKVKGADDLLGD
jgi:hypothetical protein